LDDRGETVQIPVQIERLKPGAELGLVVNGPTVSAGCSMTPPATVGASQREFLMPLTISKEATLGRRGIVVARSWRSDLRSSTPGPCTPLIELTVLP
jgi:hypothetical protein